MTVEAGLSLDHVGFMIRDLDFGAEAWERLGFQLSPRSGQMGKVPGNAAMAPWATSNHCVMFERGYLELIGITHPENFNPWDRFLDRFEGPHIVALRCAEADATYVELAKRTDGFDPPLQRLRNAPYGDGVRPFRFRNIFSQDDRYPEGRFIIIEHQTPEVIWQPGLMVHPNTAIGLAELVFVADEPRPTVERLREITGVMPEASEEGAVRFKLDADTCLSVLDMPALMRRYPDMRPREKPSVAAAIVEVSDMNACQALIRDNGVALCGLKDGGFCVTPEDANGGVLEFRKARALA